MEETKNNTKTEERGLIVSDATVFNEAETFQFTTLDLSVMENKKALYNALQQCDVKINDIKGQTIEVRDLYIEKKNVPERDEKTDEVITDENGEVVTKKHFRTILIDTEGKTYVTAAYGVYNSLKQIIGIFGDPTPENPLTLKVGTKTLKGGKESLILTVE